MAAKQYYSIRTGKNPKASGLRIEELRELFLRLYSQLESEGYFSEAFGFCCVDEGLIPGKVLDPQYEILISLRKKNIWPISEHSAEYTEDDVFDVIEFLHEHVSKPIEGRNHDWDRCGMHWDTFNHFEGQQYFREKINELLDLYVHPFTLSVAGEVLQKPEKGFENIFDAHVPSDDENIRPRVDAAIVNFRRHGASLDHRRQAVRDLADVLEFLRPKLKTLLSNKDEADLFNIANNFGIRHHNAEQKTNYDIAIWLSWMFYFYLATIHVVLRKIERVEK